MGCPSKWITTLSGLVVVDHGRNYLNTPALEELCNPNENLNTRVEERDNLVKGSVHAAIKKCTELEIPVEDRRVRRKKRVPGEHAEDAGLSVVGEKKYRGGWECALAWWKCQRTANNRLLVQTSWMLRQSPPLSGPVQVDKAAKRPVEPRSAEWRKYLPSSADFKSDQSSSVLTDSSENRTPYLNSTFKHFSVRDFWTGGK
ncbi:unnamed protein product [Clavelina lepadiformis]|uniref:Uncharacterized protein n=1 Tax=Clavelina lepadiformis TaxID=159417 RepID=A0ABP0FHF0_CLALP